MAVRRQDRHLLEALASVNHFLLQAGFPHTSRALVVEAKKAGHGTLPVPSAGSEVSGVLLASLGIALSEEEDAENISPQLAAGQRASTKAGETSGEEEDASESNEEEEAQRALEQESESGNESETESEDGEDMSLSAAVPPNSVHDTRQKKPARLSIRSREEGRGAPRGSMDRLMLEHTKPVARMKGHRNPLVHLSFVGASSRYALPDDPSHTTLFSASVDSSLRVWNVGRASGEECVALARGPDGMTDARPLEGATYAVCSSSSGAVVLLDLATNNTAQTFASASPDVSPRPSLAPPSSLPPRTFLAVRG